MGKKKGAIYGNITADNHDIKVRLFIPNFITSSNMELINLKRLQILSILNLECPVKVEGEGLDVSAFTTLSAYPSEKNTLHEEKNISRILKDEMICVNKKKWKK